MHSASLENKIALLILTIVVTCLSGLGFIAYKEFVSMLEDRLGENAQTIALASAHLVTTHLGEYRMLRTEEDQTRPYYQEMKELFERLKKSGAIRYLYTERQSTPGKIIYILDSEPLGSKESSPIGSEDDMNALRERAYAAKTPVFGPLTDDPKWGQFITGYAPLIDPSTGAFEGLLGVDIEASQVFALFRGIRNSILTGIFFITLGTAVTAQRLAKHLIRPFAMDSLTQAYTPRHKDSLVDEQVSAAKRSLVPFAVLMIDLDFFKRINDTYGHPVGDLVLSAAANAVRAALRKSDVLIRYGGEEFLLLLPATEASVALAVGERVRKGVARTPVYVGETNQTVAVTVSIGISIWSPGLTRVELIAKADQALYNSKRSGRNRVTLAEDGV